MTAQPTHRHDEFHRGVVPEAQVASGTPTAGYVPTASGTGEAAWSAAASGGGGCDHQHVTDTFTADGGVPETFTLTRTPLGVRRVHVQGLRVWPGDVGGTGTFVEVDTSAADQVVVDYETACGDLAGAVGDADGGSDEGYTWYAIPWPAVPGTWAADTYYTPGAMVVDSNGHTQIRYPNYPGLSDSVEPTWDAGGSFSGDLDGYWFDLGIDPDLDALTQTWAGDTNFGTDDSVVIVQPSTPDGRHFVGATISGLLSGPTEPGWPTTPGNESFNDGYATGFIITSRPFVLGTVDVAGFVEGIDWDVFDATQGWLEFTGFVSNGEIVFVTYTPA